MRFRSTRAPITGRCTPGCVSSPPPAPPAPSSRRRCRNSRQGSQLVCVCVCVCVCGYILNFPALTFLIHLTILTQHSYSLHYLVFGYIFGDMFLLAIYTHIMTRTASCSVSTSSTPLLGDVWYVWYIGLKEPTTVMHCHRVQPHTQGLAGRVSVELNPVIHLIPNTDI